MLLPETQTFCCLVIRELQGYFDFRSVVAQWQLSGSYSGSGVMVSQGSWASHHGFWG